MGKLRFGVAAAAAVLVLAAIGSAQADFSKMTFFVTSVGSGKGADFGGLAGADRHCQKLAHEAGASYRRIWRAYLSQSAWGDQLAVNARDRIGKGPWHNARGELIARDLDELHGNNNINKQTALTEKWDMVNGRGDKPNMHDILTGSRPDGTAFHGNEDRTCNNWRSSGEGSAMVGHHDRVGLRDDEAARSWNSSHPSRGCSLPALQSSGGAGLLYCFAIWQ
jgi:hypothetical protein